MEDEKIDLKWGLFVLQFGAILLATMLLIVGEKMIYTGSYGSPVLGVGLIAAGLGQLWFTFRPVKSGQDDFERRLQIYSIACSGAGTVIYALVWHVLIGLDIDFIGNEPVKVIGLPTIMASSKLFGEQGVRLHYAQNSTATPPL